MIAIEIIKELKTIRKRRDLCKWGHKISPQNTYINSRGRRQCRVCAAAASKVRYATRKASKLAPVEGAA